MPGVHPPLFVLNFAMQKKSENANLGTNEGDISNGDWTSAAGHYKEDATAKTISFVVQLKQTTKKT